MTKYGFGAGLNHKDRVLERLKAAVDYNEDDGWVSSKEIVQEEVGGLNGTRRLRELRKDGYEIEQKTEGKSTWYRLRIAEGPNPNACGKCGKDAYTMFWDEIRKREFTACAKCAFWFDSRSGYKRV